MERVLTAQASGVTPDHAVPDQMMENQASRCGQTGGVQYYHLDPVLPARRGRPGAGPGDR
ncbi:MAG: hypothetical protein ACLRWQ_15785 [Flavonifractor plautii]